jgi:polyketide biosynthesis acyl carrier protein
MLIEKCAREVLPDLPARALTPSDRLADFGANSMDRADILMMVLEQLRLDAPRATFAGAQNVGELASLVHRQLGAA